jgi:hypothetical protein
MSDQISLPSLMTRDEVIAYLRLDLDDRDPTERLRNLIRRQRLPVIKRGKLLLFRRASIDAWLSAAETGYKPKPRQIADLQITKTNAIRQSFLARKQPATATFLASNSAAKTRRYDTLEIWTLIAKTNC